MANTERLGPNQRRALQLLANYPGGLDNIKLTKLLGSPDRDRIRKMMLVLKERKLVHVAKWVTDDTPFNRHIYPVWTLGNHKDAERPKAIGLTQASRDYKTRKKELVGEDIWRAVNRAQEHGADRVVAGGKVVWTKQDSWLV